MEEKITVVSLGFFNPGNNVLAPTFTCSFIFVYLETKCKLTTVLRIKRSIHRTDDDAAKEGGFTKNNFGEKLGNVIQFLGVTLT